MIKSWEITAEVNMDASKMVSVKIKANTERKAVMFAKEKLKKDGYFQVLIRNVKLLEG